MLCLRHAWNLTNPRRQHRIEKTGCNRIYKLFETAYTKVFTRFENDGRIKSYLDIPQYLTEEDQESLEQTYEAFDETLGPLLCQRAYEFYYENLKKTV